MKLFLKCIVILILLSGCDNGIYPPYDWQEVTYVTAGDRVSCAIADKKLYCWGNNENGQLGDGKGGCDKVDEDTLSCDEPHYSVNPVEVDMSGKLEGKTFTKVAAERDKVCGIADGELYCWAVINIPENLKYYYSDYKRTPIKVSEREDWQEISSGGDHTCGIAGGELYCLGSKLYKEGALDSWTKVSAGYRRTCGVAGGELFCWGENFSGSIGNGDSGPYAKEVLDPFKIGDRKDWEAVSTSGSHSCGIAGGELYCWGNNGYGWITAYADGVNTNSPIRIGEKANWQFVVTGDSFTCGIENYELFCWGANGIGQLGIGKSLEEVEYEPDPVKIGIRTDWQKVSATENHVCAIAGGELYCWGANGRGEVGDGTRRNRNSPVKLN